MSILFDIVEVEDVENNLDFAMDKDLCVGVAITILLHNLFFSESLIILVTIVVFPVPADELNIICCSLSDFINFINFFFCCFRCNIVVLMIFGKFNNIF